MKNLQNKSLYIFLILGFLQLTTLNISAITIRHDVDDKKYLELGKKFTSVCALGRAGDGTLVAPQWILTAAHVARGLQSRGQGIIARCNGIDYTVETVFIHPEWTDMGPHDIALLKFSKPVISISPAEIYTESSETNQIATIAGHGDTRTGNGGQWISDNLLRGATNKIERADEKWIYLKFDAPPEGTELEGAPGRGDSGGPAFVTKNGKMYIAGVSSLGTDGKNGPGTYGAEDSFVRVSQYKKWLENVMAEREGKGQKSQAERDSQNSSINLSSAKQNLPDTPEGKVLATYIQAFNSGDEGKMREFFSANLSEDALKRRPMEDRLQAYRQMYKNLGGMIYEKLLSDKKPLFVILVKREKGERQRFEFEFTAQTKINGIANQTAEGQ